jgi:SAM-dependent methyltransferase
LPLPDRSIDIVVCGLVLPDIADLTLTFGEFARVLRPGGSLLASTLHPRGAAEGWRRTFETPDGAFEVRACWHAEGDVRRACGRHGLAVGEVREPALPGDRGSANPVALVFRAALESSAARAATLGEAT